MMIKNYQELLAGARNAMEKSRRAKILDILDKVLVDVDPYFLTERALRKAGASGFERVWMVGAGKGTYRMALAAEAYLGERAAGGHINVPEQIGAERLKKTKVTIAGHPLPTAAGLAGTKEILKIIDQAGANDLILGLFSGGASALLEMPVAEVSFDDKIALTKLLLRSSATINEINTVRKHLSQVKGGRLAAYAQGKKFLALYLSDVVGNDISAIGSGPTAPDQTTFHDAIRILKKYRLWLKAPVAIRDYLAVGEAGGAAETPKQPLAGVINIIIGNHQTVALAVQKRCREAKTKATIITAEMHGQTERAAAALWRHVLSGSRSQLWVAAGETTFKVRTPAPGGRNQQMGLVVIDKILPNTVFVAFDTDGVDGVGPEQVGGVLVDMAVMAKAQTLGLDIKKARRDNDAYNFFKQAGGQIKTGYVGTNLGDVILLLRD